MTKKTLKDIKLTLFFSEGVGLKTWADIGNLYREVILYKELLNYLSSVNFITYGGRQDYSFQKELGGINLYSSYWLRRPFRLSKYLMPFNFMLLFAKYKNIIKETDLFKTNQIIGSQIPILLKKLYNKKLIIRCGYLPTRVLANINNNELAKILWNRSRKEIFEIEKNAFQYSDINIVTTKNDRDWATKTYGIMPEKIKVVPNYVDIKHFIPIPNNNKKYDLVIVANNPSLKNIGNLIKALNRLKDKGLILSILFIGSCGRSPEVQEERKNKNFSVTLAGNIDNREIPTQFSNAKIFILPSLYEGHPKALLEAMSCGMPCIATDVSEINNIITHKNNGYLCRTDSISIAEAIEKVLLDKNLQNKIGKNARQFIVDNYSLDKIMKLELEIIKEITQKM